MIFFHQRVLIFDDSWLMNWYSLEMQTHVPPWLSLFYNGVVKRCSSCLSVIRQASWWSRKKPHWWKLHLKWIRDVILQPWLFLVSRDIVGNPPMIDVCWHKDGCHDVVACSHPCHYCWHARWCLRRWWKQVSDWLMWEKLHPTSHYHLSLSFGKTKCKDIFNITHGLSLCSSTSFEWVLLL
jgi:hypothetical protein